MFKYLILVCLTLLSSTGRASDLHLNLEKEADKVLAPKMGALTLDQVKKLVVNEDLDLQISYERLIEAQKKIGVARAAYFPYGLGTVAAMYFLNVWNPLLLVELITSLPSKIYNVQAEKNMSMAQNYSHRALRENVKNQVAQLYYGILKEETALKLTGLKIALMEAMIRTYRERVVMGLSTEDEVLELEQSLRRVRDTYLKFSAYLGEAKSAFNMMLGMDSSEGQQIELQPISTFLSSEDYQRDMAEMTRMALERSNEIVAADYMVTAARKSKKSTKWSVLSFGGIGFDYYFRIQVAGSKIEQAQLNRQFVEDNLVNQVYLIDNAFKRGLEHVQSEREIFKDTDFYMKSNLEMFKAGSISLDKLLEVQMTYLNDFNELIQSHYLSLGKLDDLERVLMGDAVGLNSSEIKEAVQVSLNNKNNEWHNLSVNVPAGMKIVKVIYEFEDGLGLRPMTSYASGNDFTVGLKLYGAVFLAGNAVVTLENGDVITKSFRFNI